MVILYIRGQCSIAKGSVIYIFIYFHFILFTRTLYLLSFHLFIVLLIQTSRSRKQVAYKSLQEYKLSTALIERQ